jgi:hypothetical protein
MRSHDAYGVDLGGRRIIKKVERYNIPIINAESKVNNNAMRIFFPMLVVIS